MEYRKHLNGRIYLITGNHDGYNIETYYKAGFDRVYDKPIILNEYLILSHKPLFVNEDMPYANIYGHVHNRPDFLDYTSNTFCVSCQRIDYTPILIDEIIEKMKQYT